MNCPKCDSSNTVANSYMPGNGIYGRVYECKQCGCMFSTVELYTGHAKKLLHSGKFDWEAEKK